MPATQCLPAYDAMPGWTNPRESKVSLDLTIPSNVLARRGAISFCSGGNDVSYPRRERRGAISYDRTDKNAVYLRKLGDVRIRSQLESPLQQRRRSCIEASEQKALQALAVTQKTRCSKFKFMTLHVDGKRKRKPLPRSSCNGGDSAASLLDDCYVVQTKCLLARVSDWSFNVFLLDKSTNGRSLFYITLEVFKLHGLTEYFQLDIVKLMKFATLVEEGYHSNPYHNSVHAADVAQAVHCYLMQTKLHDYLTPIEKLVAIIAAVSHDLYHPGLNQAFLIATANPLASLYKNNAVLENHHWRSALGIMRHSGVFSHFTNTLWKLVEQQVKSLILATDMTRQQEFFSRLKKYVEDVNIELTKYEDRHFILQIALKCADISNPCRSWDICRVWSEKVCEEFFQQGDYERKLRLPITNQCDRHRCTVPKIQTGFIDYVVLPLFRLWVKFMPTHMLQEQLNNLSGNKQNWQDLAKAEQDSAAVSLAAIPVTSSNDSVALAAIPITNSNDIVTSGVDSQLSTCTAEDASADVGDSDISCCSLTATEDGALTVECESSCDSTDGAQRMITAKQQLCDSGNDNTIIIMSSIPVSLLAMADHLPTGAGRRHSAPGVPKLLERLSLRRDSFPIALGDALSELPGQRHGSQPQRRRCSALPKTDAYQAVSCDRLTDALTSYSSSSSSSDDDCSRHFAFARPRLSSLTPNHEASCLTNYLLSQNFAIK